MSENSNYGHLIYFTGKQWSFFKQNLVKMKITQAMDFDNTEHVLVYFQKCHMCHLRAVCKNAEC